MIDDIHEPLKDYESIFKQAHAEHTATYFEDLVEQAGIDADANAQTIKELDAIGEEVSGNTSSNKKWNILRWGLIATALILSIYILSVHPYWWLFGVALVFAGPIIKINHKIDDVKHHVAKLETKRDAKRDEAWEQMATLNALYNWDIAGQLIKKTTPRIEFDDYFTNARLTDLKENFGFNDIFNHADHSVVFSHSGVINGNPFILAETIEHWMGTKTYHGSINISWTEYETDQRGNRIPVTRSQTLNASVDKPYPLYNNKTFILFGNEAAPNLSFSRTPSNLSKLKDGFWGNMRKKRAGKALDKKSRDLSNSFTTMSNQEFDTLFGALDRDHETQFRLLFTPLAQQEMLKLLKDKTVGYGDNFAFMKEMMINMVTPEHLQSINISSSPQIFHSYNLNEARKTFNEYHNNLFKSFYFAIAPILSIPLYQQHRPHHDIYKDLYSKQSCYWEHETIANFYGDEAFSHPECVTHNIFKTQAKADVDGTQTIKVTASGYAAQDRVDYISVYGGDGSYHDVPVEWVEYINVQQESNMMIKEQVPATTSPSENTQEAPMPADDQWEAVFQSRGVDANNVHYRRSILSALLD